MEGIPFVDRKRELKRLQNLLRSTNPETLLIIGEEGTGKTALLREFAAFLDTDTRHLVSYQAVQPEVGLTPALLEVERSIQDILDRKTVITTDVRQPRLNTVLRRKVRATPSGIERLGSGTSLEEITRSFAEGLLGISRNLGRDQLLILLLDLQLGVQTQDKETLINLHHSLPKAVKLVLALPDSENELAIGPSIPQIRLGPLTQDSAQELLSAYANLPSSDLLGISWERFKGLPLATTALARLLRDGYPDSINGLPSSLTGTFKALIGELDAADMRVVQVLAILFEPADISLIAEISELTESAVGQVVSRNRVTRLLDWEKRSTKEYQLFHPSLDKYIVQEGMKPILNELHRNAAKRYLYDIEEYWQNPKALGYCLEHLRLSDATDYVGFVTSPDVRILMQIWGTSDLANIHLREALKAAKDTPQKIWLQLIDSNEIVTLGEVSTSSRSVPPESLLLRDLGYFSRLDSDFKAAKEYYRRALQVLQEDQSTKENTSNLSQQAEAWMELAELYRAQSMLDSARDALDRSRKLYESLLKKNPENTQQWEGRLCRCWHNTGVVLRDVGLQQKRNRKFAKARRSLQEALRAFHKALDLATEESVKLDELTQIGYGHLELTEIEEELGNTQKMQAHLQEAVDAYQQGLATAQRLGDIHSVANASGNLSLLSLKEENFHDAASYARSAIHAFTQLGAVEQADQARALLAKAQTKLRADEGRQSKDS